MLAHTTSRFYALGLLNLSDAEPLIFIDAGNLLKIRKWCFRKILPGEIARFFDDDACKCDVTCACLCNLDARIAKITWETVRTALGAVLCFSSEQVTMAYEVFARNSPLRGNAYLSFGNNGSLALNQAASRQLKTAGVEFVIVLWDSVEKKLALQVARDASDERAYKVRFNKNGNGANVSAKSFLEYAGINYAAKKKAGINIKVEPNADYVVEAKIPDAWFAAAAPVKEAA